MNVKIGIIGGSGFVKGDFFQYIKDSNIQTKWGSPSSALKEGTIGGVPVAFLLRHGEGHCITPTHVNNRANIAALKEVGCTHIFASTAVGSLREEMKPGDLVVLDQFIDFTRLRVLSFYDDFKDSVQHVSTADPFDARMRSILNETLTELGYDFHDKGTVITIEGPRFSTRAESHMYRTLGADLVNMSIAPEAILAIEAGIPYAAVAMSTDYDAWRVSVDPVTWEEICQVMTKNISKLTTLISKTVPKMESL